MSRHIAEIRGALSNARRAYHYSTSWNEPIEYDGSGPTYDQEIERAMVMAEARIAELEAALSSCVGLLLLPHDQVDDQARRTVTEHAKQLIR